MEAVKNKEIKCIFFYSLDRISRNVKDFCEIKEILEDYDVNFYSASENFENINDTSYSYNSTLYKTKVYVGGEGEGSDRVYVELGGGEGYNLREVFVDAKDIQSLEFSTNEEYLDALKQRGQEKLSSMVEVEAFDYQTSAMGNFKYKKDYDLGDIVTIRKESWGISLNKRITGIEEVYEQGGVIINPTLGEPIPESISWED